MRRVKGQRHKSLYRPDHPKASASGMVYEHVLIAEAALGRLLPAGVEVHHVDEDGKHNKNRNLVICEDKTYHKLLHVRMRVVRAGGNPDTQRICCACQRPRLFSEFNRSRRPGGLQGKCRECSHEYDHQYERKPRVRRKEAGHVRDHTARSPGS